MSADHFTTSLLRLALLAAVLVAQCRTSTVPKDMPLVLPKDATPSPLLLDPPTPPLLLPRNATTPAPPPLVFPDDAKNYKIVTNNATILATLTRQDKPDATPKAAEVDDMVKATNDQEKDTNTMDKTPEGSTTPKAVTQVAAEVTEKDQESTDVPSAPDAEAELIQPVHKERQSNEHEEQFNKHHHHKAQHEQAFLKHMRITDTTAIMAGSFAAVAVLGFVGLVMWRQMLERKYGTRERLVTEDTYYTNNDLRHFEL